MIETPRTNCPTCGTTVTVGALKKKDHAWE
ncbi:hypothetical protein SEA_JEMMNO_192 [Mycobacterium phage Jemmno]|nr:hypothetical protein SEA_JEMMNO_192 [Mycobacterium phage Jemmno]